MPWTYATHYLLGQFLLVLVLVGAIAPLLWQALEGVSLRESEGVMPDVVLKPPPAPTPPLASVAPVALSRSEPIVDPVDMGLVELRAAQADVEGKLSAKVAADAALAAAQAAAASAAQSLVDAVANRDNKRAGFAALIEHTFSGP